MRSLRAMEQRVLQVREVRHVRDNLSLAWCLREWVECRRRVRPHHLGDDVEGRIVALKRYDVPLE